VPDPTVRASGKDDKAHKANVLDWKDVGWAAYLVSRTGNDSPPYGPHVVVCWSHNDETFVILL
jgi:hypothetical protein